MADPAVQINVLGPLEVVIEGSGIALPSRAQRTLLLRLATDGGSPVPGDALIEAIWGDDLPKDPKNALRYHVWKLREALAARDLIATVANGYRLVVDDGQLDARRFEHLVNGAVTALDPRSALRDLEEALDLWRGRPYHDVADEEFAQPDIRRLRELRRLAREERARRLLEVGREAEAIPELEALLEEHPHSEASWSTMMTALYRVGRQSDALAAYQRARRLLGDDLGIEPTPELRRLEEAVLLHDASLGRPAVFPTNLPLSLTSFVGRDDDTARVLHALASKRLVTIVGPGGAGKTRLAIECARKVADRFSDGTWIIDLTRLKAGDDVLEAIFRELDIARTEVDGTKRIDLLGFLGHRRFLLVFDNCEHLPDDVADAAVAILERCAEGRVLATSRGALGIAGEHVVSLSGMECPAIGDDWDAVVSTPAGKLFVDRSTDAGAEIPHSPESAEIVGRICRLVEGMPLAIELAAARTRTVPIADLAPQLGTRLSAYGEQRGTAERHRSMDATIEWSHGLLDEKARTVFRRLGAFVGGFTTDAAIHTCSEAELTPVDVTDAIEKLVARSMVERMAHATPRFRLLEPFRLFALARLEAAGEWERVMRTHAEAYAEVVIGSLEHQRGPLRNDIYQGLRDESANVRSALEWFERSDRPHEMCRMVSALTGFWLHDARATELVRWARACEPYLDGLDPADAARIRVLLAHAAAHTGDSDEASRHMRLAFELTSEGTDELVRADVITAFLGDTDVFSGPMSTDHVTQNQLAEEALDIYRRHGDRWGQVAALTAACVSLLWWRDDSRYREVIPLARLAAEIAEEIGDVEGQMWALNNEATALMAEHVEGSAPTDDILRVFDEVFGLADRAISKEPFADNLLQAAWFAFRNGEVDDAIDMCQRSARIADDNHLLFSATAAHTSIALFAEERDPHLARRSILTGLRRAETRGVDRQTVWVVEVAARLLAKWGQPELAARLIGAAEHERAADHNPTPSWDVPTYTETVARIRSSCGRRFQPLRSEGAAWSIREAAQVARQALVDL